MIFKSTSGGHCDVWIGHAPFYPKEAGPQSDHPEWHDEKRSPQGFNIEFNPYYDTRKDPRVRDSKTPKPLEMEKWVIDELKKSHGYGKNFIEWKPEEQKVEITAGELEELRRKAAGADGKNEEKAEGKQEKQKVEV